MRHIKHVDSLDIHNNSITFSAENMMEAGAIFTALGFALKTIYTIATPESLPFLASTFLVLCAFTGVVMTENYKINKQVNHSFAAQNAQNEL